MLKNSADILNIINVSSTVRLSDRKIFQTQESMKTPSMPTATASGLSVSWTHKASNSYFDDCNNKKVSYRRDSTWCGRIGYSMSLKVIRCCANRRATHDFLFTLNSNLRSIFNRSSHITPSLHIRTPPPFYVELKRRLCVHGWTCFGVRVPRTLHYPTINLNPR